MSGWEVKRVSTCLARLRRMQVVNPPRPPTAPTPPLEGNYTKNSEVKLRSLLKLF
jgi:hypothetical protein